MANKTAYSLLLIWIASKFLPAKGDTALNKLLIESCRSSCSSAITTSASEKCNESPDCYMCWSMCELLVVDSFSWSPMCESEQKELCPIGCKIACQQIFGGLQIEEVSTQVVPSTNEETTNDFTTSKPSVTDSTTSSIQHTIDFTNATGVLQTRLVFEANFLTEKIHIDLERLSCQYDKSLPACLNSKQHFTITAELSNDDRAFIVLPGLTYNSKYRLTMRQPAAGRTATTYFQTTTCVTPDKTWTVCVQKPTVKPTTENTHQDLFSDWWLYAIAATTALGVSTICLTTLLWCTTSRNNRSLQASAPQRNSHNRLTPRRSWTGSYTYLPQVSTSSYSHYGIVWHCENNSNWWHMNILGREFNTSLFNGSV